MDICLPYNIKSDHCPLTRGGVQGQSKPVDLDLLLSPSTLGGALSLSTGRLCHIKPVGPVSPKKKKREDEGRRSQGVNTKSEGQARGKTTAAGSRRGISG